MPGTATLEVDGMFLVLAGTFNPIILQPSWLASKNLISQEEADAAVVEVIHRDLTVFQAGWLRVHVEQGRFQVHTADPSYYLPLRDLVVGVFTLLEHTPVRALGIIRNLHYRLDSEQSWHLAGDMLAPKEPWRGVLDPLGPRADGTCLPGLRRLVMEGKRPGSSAKWLRMKVEVSNRVRPGIYIEAHEHHEADDPDALKTILGVLEREWDEALRFADQAAERLLSNVSMTT